jgi:hypothetical protein
MDGLLKKAPDTKYLIAIIVIIVLILVYIAYGNQLKEKITGTKTTKSGTAKKSRSKKPRTRSNSKTLPETSDDDETTDTDTAQELYNLVHDRMVTGMQSDEFIDVVGDLADNFTYVEIKQLYNNAKKRGADPSTTVTVDQYAKLLDKRAASE